ncbi:MAG: hypothetical protein FWF51_04880 [Chitinivibrionia bacterium]|nr:hypothetical protein [Chitinivibrionia bacterium]
MKEAKYLVKTHPKWLEIEKSTPNKPAVVLSQKIGLSRNIKKYPFLDTSTNLEKEAIYSDVSAAVKKSNIYTEERIVEMNLLTSSNMVEMLLFEKDIIPVQVMSCDWTRGVFADMTDVLPTILVNMKNHLNIVSFCDKGKEESTLAKLNEIDNILGEELLYAYDSRLGFLTAKPEECGSGLFMETIVHIPGLVLTEEIGETLNGLSVMGARAEGLFNEKFDAWGAFFKIILGNGLDEKEIVEKTKEIQNALIVAETKARKRLFKEAKLVMEDKIYRSFAMMKYARIMPLSQLFNFLSILRLGSEYKAFPASLRMLNVIFERGFTANLILSLGNPDTSPGDIDEERAKMYRSLLKDIEV